MVKTLTGIMNQEGCQSVLAVSHGEVCLHFLRALQDPAEELKKGFGNCCIFDYTYQEGHSALEAGCAAGAMIQSESIDWATEILS